MIRWLKRKWRLRGLPKPPAQFHPDIAKWRRARAQRKASEHHLKGVKNWRTQELIREMQNG